MRKIDPRRPPNEIAAHSLALPIVEKCTQLGCVGFLGRSEITSTHGEEEEELPLVLFWLFQSN